MDYYGLRSRHKHFAPITRIVNSYLWAMQFCNGVCFIVGLAFHILRGDYFPSQLWNNNSFNLNKKRLNSKVGTQSSDVVMLILNNAEYECQF